MELPMWAKIILLPFASLFFGVMFALIPFFLTGLQAQGMKKLGLEEKVGFIFSFLLFIGGIIFGALIVLGKMP